MARLVLAPAFAWTLAGGGWTPLALFALAAASDYVDGPIARRAGPPSRHGALLDSMADVAFVLAGTAAGAASGRLSWAVPLAIVAAAAPYLLATLRRSRAAAGARAYSAVGHAAGVCNYALVGLLAGSVALPGAAWPPILGLGSVLVVGLATAAVAHRIRGVRRSGA